MPAPLPPIQQGSEALTGLAKAHAERAARRARGEPEPERLDPIERARRNPTSLRLAITAKCWDCSGRRTSAKLGACSTHVHRRHGGKDGALPALSRA